MSVRVFADACPIECHGGKTACEQADEQPWRTNIGLLCNMCNAMLEGINGYFT